MEYRLLRMEDYDKVYALWMSSKNMGFNDLDDSREGVGKFLARNPATSFAAFDGDTLSGVILGGHDGRRGYIYHLAVREEYRRQGVGKTLVKLCLDAMKSEGINKAALLVLNRNQAGNAFWESQGFSRREDVAYRNRELAKLRRIDT